MLRGNSIFPLKLTYAWPVQELHSARSSFEQARFNLVCELLTLTLLLEFLMYVYMGVMVSLTVPVNFQVTAISHIEAKKRFEFLEAVSATMDSHLRYFKQVAPCIFYLLVMLYYSTG
jgi:hypothetical protein